MLYVLYAHLNENFFFSVTTMMVVTEVVVVEEDITENADHHLTTKVDHAMIDHAHVPILHVSLEKI